MKYKDTGAYEDSPVNTLADRVQMQIAMNSYPGFDIFAEAKRSNLDILKYKEAFTKRDYKGRLPIYYLAGFSCKEVLEYPECFEARDLAGDSIFHALARSGCLEILNYPETYRLKNLKSLLPIHILLDIFSISVSKLSEEYQIRAGIKNFGKDKILTINDFEEMVKVPASVLFIMGL